MEIDALRRDGTEFPVELVVSEARVGETRTFCAFVRDVTKRKAAEEALRKSEAQLEEAQEIASMGSFEFNVQTSEFLLSDQVYRIMGLEPEPHSVGIRMMQAIVHPDDLDEFQRDLENLGLEPLEVEREHRVLRSDDSVRHVHILARSQPDEHGTVRKIIGVMHDITERKIAESAFAESQERLLTQQTTLFDLATSEYVQIGDLDRAFRKTTEAAAKLLDVERVSIWELDELGSSLLSSNLFEASSKRHSKTQALAVAEYPRYFAALEAHPTIDASDALTDSRTIEFRDSYLAPNGISSMLDAGIRVRGALVGVVCHEHVGEKRIWTPDEANFARALADLLGRAIEQRHRINDQRSLRDGLKTINELRERIEAENIYLKEEAALSGEYEDPIGKSKVWMSVLRRTEQVAQTDAGVLILGETGTGKDTVAQLIHRRSRRREQPFVHVSCTALPESLAESELFGHERGAFTGAIQRRLGRFEIADGGTLFLDEVGDLPLALQLKLLRVLERGEFERVGSTDTQRVSVRLLAATNRDLEKEAAAGLFREDLYYRLGVFPIWLPPLRDRIDDIPLLTWYFVHKLGTKLGKSLDTIPQHIFDRFKSYRWPGNVRELENVIERAMILTTGSTLKLDESILGSGRRESPILGAQLQLDDVQRDHIVSVLEGCDWKIKGKGKAAECLGMHPSTLYARMKKLGVKRPLPA